MQWIEATISTSTEAVEIITDILLTNGVNGCAVEDKEDFRAFLEHLPEQWDYIEESLLSRQDAETKIVFYVPQNQQGQASLSKIERAIARLKQEDPQGRFGALSMALGGIGDEDYENNWKQYFKPFAVGNRLLIKPTWEALPAGSSGKIVVEIDPSSAFGTGSHMTTMLCLEALERILPPRPVSGMLDMGCGSGILGIAAKKLGAEHITAVDTDQNAVRIARENARANHFTESHYAAFVGNILTDKVFLDKLCEKKYQVIAANIVADAIIAMAPHFARLLCEGGRLIVSGILSRRADETLRGLESAGLSPLSVEERDSWACAVLTL